MLFIFQLLKSKSIIQN